MAWRQSIHKTVWFFRNICSFNIYNYILWSSKINYFIVICVGGPPSTISKRTVSHGNALNTVFNKGLQRTCRNRDTWPPFKLDGRSWLFMCYLCIVMTMFGIRGLAGFQSQDFLSLCQGGKHLWDVSTHLSNHTFALALFSDGSRTILLLLAFWPCSSLSVNSWHALHCVVSLPHFLLFCCCKPFNFNFPLVLVNLI